MRLKIFTDGGSKGNPGKASIGVVIYDDRQEIIRFRDDIGIATNNVAEYTAVIRALEYVKHELANKNKAKIEFISFYSDSTLIVNQLNGLYKIKNATIRELVFKTKILEQEIAVPISYHHIPREKNLVADAMVNGRG